MGKKVHDDVILAVSQEMCQGRLGDSGLGGIACQETQLTSEHGALVVEVQRERHLPQMLVALSWWVCALL